MCLLGDKEQNEGNKESEQRHEESWHKGLDNFFLPRMTIQILFLGVMTLGFENTTAA
jgi:hypothetical protein